MDETSHQSDPLRRARLRWRARRGLLENDLMDLLLARKEPEGDLADADVARVLEILRTV
jgi:antitoxin CptB